MPQSEQFDHTYPKLDNQVVTRAVYTHNTVGNVQLKYLVSDNSLFDEIYVTYYDYQMSVGMDNNRSATCTIATC